MPSKGPLYSLEAKFVPGSGLGTRAKELRRTQPAFKESKVLWGRQTYKQIIARVPGQLRS